MPGTASATGSAVLPALAVRGLWKRFGTNVAVADVTLDLPRGCFFGLVGPNGAGKTTTLRMVTGLLRPDAGDVWISSSTTATACARRWRSPGPCCTPPPAVPGRAVRGHRPGVGAGDPPCAGALHRQRRDGGLLAYGGLGWWLGRRAAVRWAWWRQPELLAAISLRQAE